MSFYCGIDLSARASQLCVINQQLARLIDQKVPNDLDRIIRLLEPYRADLKIVVESTFNWYWLVDGLRAAGFDVCLAHTLGLYMITGAKVKTDRRDAFSLAKLLPRWRDPTSLHLPSRDQTGARSVAPAGIAGPAES